MARREDRQERAEAGRGSSGLAVVWRWFGVLREGRRRALIGRQAQDHQDRQKPGLGGVLLNLLELLPRVLDAGRVPEDGSGGTLLFIFFIF